MTKNGMDNEDIVVCCFNRSSEIEAEIDSAVHRLREEVKQAKKLINDLCVELTSAFDAQLAAVELRRKALHLSMKACPDPDARAPAKAKGFLSLATGEQASPNDWETFCWDIPVRAANALKQDKIDSFEKLCRLEEHELLRTPNFGKRSLSALKEELTRRGLTLARQ